MFVNCMHGWKIRPFKHIKEGHALVSKLKYLSDCFAFFIILYFLSYRNYLYKCYLYIIIVNYVPVFSSQAAWLCLFFFKALTSAKHSHTVFDFLLWWPMKMHFFKLCVRVNLLPQSMIMGFWLELRLLFWREWLRGQNNQDQGLWNWQLHSAIVYK